MSDNPEEIRKHVRAYVGIFLMLLGLTALTVAVAYFHMPLAIAVGVALVIALFKGSLVAAFFMHLIGEHKIIYWVLAFTIAFFLPLLLFPLITERGNHGRPVAPEPTKIYAGGIHAPDHEGDAAHGETDH